MQNNGMLCGQLPTCLETRVASLANTGLVNASNASANPLGGGCSLLPPECDLQAGCG